MKELSNRGRWGKDDQRGAANPITPAKRKQALALARTGEIVSLAHDTSHGEGGRRGDALRAPDDRECRARDRR